MAPRRPRLTAVPITDSGTPTVRVALYRRASTDEANQPYSLDAQEQRLRPYAASHPGWQVVGDYVERASAKDIEGRPQLKALLKAAAAGEFDLVLVARIDRWSRSLGDLLYTVDDLAAAGVAFHSATEHFDTATPMGKLTLQMLGIFATGPSWVTCGTRTVGTLAPTRPLSMPTCSSRPRPSRTHAPTAQRRPCAAATSS